MDWSDWAPTGLRATVLEAPDGRRWRIVLSLPPGEMPAGGWPLLWGLDGDTHGLTLIETVRRLERRGEVTGVSPLAVAVLMGGDAPLSAADRYEVFTPGPPAAAEETPKGHKTGGAHALMAFLAGPAAEAVGSAGGVDTARPLIWGHSFSGYFTLWMAGQSGDGLAGVAAISPSLWWDEAAVAPTPAPVYLTAGSREDRADERGMVRRLHGLAEARRARGLPTSLSIFEGEDHGSIVSASLAQALRELSRGLKP